MEYENIADAYKGKNIFITGATGFIGKVTLEKLLYSCAGLEKVYVLVREKPTVDVHQTIKNILELPLFSRLKEKLPQTRNKIVPIVGDLLKPNFGINIADEQILIKEVSFVFHLAATTKFNDPFKTSIDLNVIATEHLLNLCRRMKNIQALVYMSTAYSNANRSVINEIIYPAPAPLNEITRLINTGGDDNQFQQLLEGRPNFYVLSKALAENLVAENHGHVPTVIIRPSIVCSCNSEPLVGWIDSWFGATHLIMSITKGLIKVVRSDPNNILDLVPVDFVSNLTIVAAAKCKSAKEVTIYNCCTSKINPLPMKYFSNYVINDSIKHKFYSIPKPMLIFTKTKWLVTLLTFFLQIIPVYIADAYMFLTGQNIRFMNKLNKAMKIRENLEYFTLNTWSIDTSKTQSLYASLSKSDKICFSFDLSSINWKLYLINYCFGIRNYLYKSKY